MTEEQGVQLLAAVADLAERIAAVGQLAAWSVVVAGAVAVVVSVLVFMGWARVR